MVKKIRAVTNIKGSEGTWIDSGGFVDPSTFSKDELNQLYDAGALEIVEVEEPDEEQAKSEWFDEPETKTPDTEVTDEPETPAPSKSTPKKATGSK